MRLRSSIALLLSLAACSQPLDWREVRPEGSALTLLMPCRPQRQARDVDLGGQPLHLVLHACSAGGHTWALAFADLDDPARVDGVLRALQRAAVGNIGAAQTAALPLDVPGATPNAASGRVALGGRLPDGSEVREQVAVFAYGTRVFQATAVGPQLPDEAVGTFFASLRLRS